MRSHDLHWTIHESPVGPLTLIGDALVLTGVHFEGYAHGLGADRREPEAPPLAAAAAQLDEYFAGERRDFDLELDLERHRVPARRLGRAAPDPVRRDVSYGELARRLGRPERVRAVGAANGRNPVAIVVPCHRVDRRATAASPATAAGSTASARCSPSRARRRSRCSEDQTPSRSVRPSAATQVLRAPASSMQSGGLTLSTL